MYSGCNLSLRLCLALYVCLFCRQKIGTDHCVPCGSLLQLQPFQRLLLLELLLLLVWLLLLWLLWL